MCPNCEKLTAALDSLLTATTTLEQSRNPGVSSEAFRDALDRYELAKKQAVACLKETV